MRLFFCCRRRKGAQVVPEGVDKETSKAMQVPIQKLKKKDIVKFSKEDFAEAKRMRKEGSGRSRTPVNVEDLETGFNEGLGNLKIMQETALGRQMITTDIRNKGLNYKQLAFLQRYGFVAVRGILDPATVAAARQSAEQLMARKGKLSYNARPEMNIDDWGRCGEQALIQLSRNDPALLNVKKLLFDGELHQDNFTQFGPRIPVDKIGNQPAPKYTEPPYDVNNLPSGLSPFSVQFLKDAAEIGIQLAPAAKFQGDAWHVDQLPSDKTPVPLFTLLQAIMITPLPYGNMGNFQVIPGSHYSVAKGIRQKNWRDLKLKEPEACDGVKYQLCAEAGDVVFCNSMLGHGIGINTSSQTRLATFSRGWTKTFGDNRQIFGEGRIDPNRLVPQVHRWMENNNVQSPIPGFEPLPSDVKAK